MVNAPRHDVATIDRDAPAPSGHPCEACGCPVEPLDKFCPACGAPQQMAATVIPASPPGGVLSVAPMPDQSQASPEIVEAEQINQKFFRCQNCGSEVATDPDHRSYVCPFCDSTYVVEFSPELAGRQRPEFIIGFAITPEDAQEKFRHWIGHNGWFCPGDLSRAMVADKMKGVYLPFWSFSMLAESDWGANIGEFWYRTETYVENDEKGNPVTKTRQVQETEWWPLQGRHHRYYSGYLVSGSRGLSQADAERIKPFQLPSLKRYAPYFLAGWFCEEYSIARDEALKRCQEEFFQWEQRNVNNFLPGDTHAQVQVNTTFSNVNSDLCLLPVYVLSYRYQDKLFRFLLNGQTGKMDGDKPLSWGRVTAAIVGGILLFLLVVLIAMAFGAR